MCSSFFFYYSSYLGTMVNYEIESRVFYSCMIVATSHGNGVGDGRPKDPRSVRSGLRLIVLGDMSTRLGLSVPGALTLWLILHSHVDFKTWAVDGTDQQVTA
jgi:hypothetical protein